MYEGVVASRTPDVPVSAVSTSCLLEVHDGQKNRARKLPSHPVIDRAGPSHLCGVICSAAVPVPLAYGRLQPGRTSCRYEWCPGDDRHFRPSSEPSAVASAPRRPTRTVARNCSRIASQERRRRRTAGQSSSIMTRRCRRPTAGKRQGADPRSHDKTDTWPRPEAGGDARTWTSSRWVKPEGAVFTRQGGAPTRWNRPIARGRSEHAHGSRRRSTDTSGLAGQKLAACALPAQRRTFLHRQLAQPTSRRPTHEQAPAGVYRA